MTVFLIILGSILFILFIVLPLFIFFFSGSKIKQMIKKSDKKLSAMKGMDISFYNNGPMKDIANKGLEYMDTLTKEEFTMQSFDGYKLHAFYFKNPYKETNKFVLGMHGFKSGPLHEYAPYIKHYFDLGFNLVLPDERAHYRSEGKYITMGANERIDTIDWLNFMVNKFGSDIEILMHGVSMGAATVNLASNMDLPKQVIGIVSDCAYSSFEFIMDNVMKQIGKFPTKPIIRGIENYLKWFLKIDLKNNKPIDAVKTSKVPILYVHGKLDQIVPVQCSYDLYDKCSSRKKLWIVDEANHAESVGFRMDEYFAIIKEFFNLN